MIAQGYKRVWIIIFSLFFCQQLSAFVPNAVTDVIDGINPFNNPYGIAITSDSLTAYVCNYDGNTVSIIDITTNAFIGTVYDPHQYIQKPQFIVISADGHTAYVTCNSNIPNGQSNNLGGVAIIDLNAGNSTYNTVTALVADLSTPTFNAPYGIAINPHLVGGVYYAYVTNSNGNTVSIINTTTNAVINTVTDTGNLIQTPYGIAITPTAVNNKYYAYVCNYAFRGGISIIDVTPGSSYNKVIGNVNFNGFSTGPYKTISVAFASQSIDNKYYAYVVDYQLSVVFVIDVRTKQPTFLINTENAFLSPNYIIVDSTSTYGYVTNASYSYVTVFSLSDNSIIIRLGDLINLPNACALSADGNYLYLTNNNLDASTYNNTVTQIALNDNYNGFSVLINSQVAIAISSDGTKAYVGNVNGGVLGAGYISIIDLTSNSLDGLINDSDGVLAPVAIAITKDGTIVYATNASNNLTGIANIAVVDLSSNAVSNHIPLEDISDVYCSALTQDDSKLYVGTNSGIVVVDTTTNTISSSIDNTPGTISIAMRAGTTDAYVVYDSGEGGYAVGVVDTADNTIITPSINDPQSLLTQPSYIAISPDGTTAYVINNNNDIYNIVIINLLTNTATGLITDSASTFTQPITIVFSKDGSAAYVMNEGPNQNTNPYSYAVSIIDTDLAKVTNTIISNSFNGPYSMAITPNGFTGYVVNNSVNSVSVVSISQPIQHQAVQAPASMDIKTKLNTFLQYTDIVNLISWTVPEGGQQAVEYQIYRDAALTDLVAIINATDPLLYLDRHLQANTTYSYYIVSVDSFGNLSEPITMSITT